MDRSPSAALDEGPSSVYSRERSPDVSENDRLPALKRARSSSERTSIKLASPDQIPVDTSPTATSKFIPEGRLDYPRRRAVIACEICRSRKSRCDGGRPKCSLCTELKAECVYREPGIKLDAGDRLILERLSHIEGLLQSSLIASASAPTGPISPANSNTTSDDLQAKRLSNLMTSAASPMALSRAGASMATNISTMPKTHTTPALHLLQWPVIRNLVSRQCDPRILVQLEMSREPIDLTLRNGVDLDDDNVNLFARAFFHRVNVWYAVVSPYQWHNYFRAATAQGFRYGSESCVVLLVLALGQAAHAGASLARPGERQPGMDYFAAAWYILPGLMVRNDVLSAQCHILAAAYMMYLVRPLEAWNLLCNASIKLQLLFSSAHSIPPTLKDLSERIYWNALLIESDLLAELDLPHSGIVQFEESMRLPRSFQYDATVTGPDEPPGNDDLWYFLAEIALRRLLNRVSHLIYAPKGTSPTSMLVHLEPVVAELDYQLTQWYEGLPPTVRFPRERLPAQNPIQTVLRLRYFACRTIIFRPYVQAVLDDEGLADEPGVRDACAKCLEACLRQVENLPAHHAGHLPYLWQGALSIVSQTLLLMGASLSDGLAALLPPRAQVDAIIAEVVREIERLAPAAPSLRLCADIVREADERRRAQMYSKPQR